MLNRNITIHIARTARPLHRMGHWDELVLGDALFPGDGCNERVLRALINLDAYAPAPLAMMAPVLRPSSG